MQRVSLCFQEPIQGPENSPIARFDGLFCYQTKSKKPIAACAACGLAEAAPQSPSQRGQTAARPNSDGQTAAAKERRPKSSGQRAAVEPQRPNRKSQTQPSRRFRACGFRARRSFFRSKFKAPKTAPSHGFRSFAAIKPRARKPIAARAACGSCAAKPKPARPNGGTAKQRRLNGSGQRAATKRRRLNRKGQTARARRNHRGAFALADSVPAAHFSGANPRPRKQPYRTV